MELSLLEVLVFPVLREILSTKGVDGDGKFFVFCGR
jgi:glutaredoxin 2